jgi:hypothetical protein
MNSRASLALSLLLLVAMPVHASPMDDAVAQYESAPGRPLVAKPGTTQHYAGINVDLSDRDVTGRSPGEIWTLPLGGGFGLTRKLEIGMNIDLLLSPWAVQNVLSTIRLYGRYLLIPKMLAIETAFHVPTAFSGTLGIEVTVPARFRFGPMEVFAQGRLLYRGGAVQDQILIGVAASALYEVVDRLFTIADLGFATAPSRIDIGFVEPSWVNDWRLPLAVGAGYELLDDLFIKAMFGFNDLARDPGAFDQRFFQITVVHALNLSGEQEPITDDGEPVTDPLAVPALDDPTAGPQLEGIPEEEDSEEGAGSE